METELAEVERLRAKGAAIALEAGDILITLINKLGELTDIVGEGNRLIANNDLEVKPLDSGTIGAIGKPLISTLRTIDQNMQRPEYQGDAELLSRITRAIRG